MPRTNRRRFLQHTALGVGGLLVLPSARTALGYAANERLRLAVVGMAGYGALHGFAEGLHTWATSATPSRATSICGRSRRSTTSGSSGRPSGASPTMPSSASAAAEDYGPLVAKKPPLFADFRRMFDEAAKEFDAVVVATPDHTHAIIAAAALRAGKPVFAEKPLTISAHEAPGAARNWPKNTRKLPTQMNNHGAAQPGFRRGVEIIREGLLGDVREVHVFFSRGGRNFQSPPQGHRAVPTGTELGLLAGAGEVARVSPGLDQPHRLARDEHRRAGQFRAALGQHGLHGAERERPVGRRRRPAGGFASRPNAPRPISFPIRGGRESAGKSRPAASCRRWPSRGTTAIRPTTPPGSRKMLEGILRDHGATDADVKAVLPDAGCLIVGSKGLLATNSHNTEIAAASQGEVRRTSSRSGRCALPASPGHYKEWIEACRGWPDADVELRVRRAVRRVPQRRQPLDAVPRRGNRVRSGQRADHESSPRGGVLRYEYRKGWTI